MHKTFKIYYFIDKFDREEIEKLNKNISLIFRIYKEKYDIKTIKNIKKICDKQKRDLFIANNLRLALSLNLSGIYIPSFNRLTNFNNVNFKKNFKIIGSAHNTIEIKNKEKQGCEEIFISPIFNTNKSNFFLDVLRFNLIANNSKKPIIALGGINYSNLNKLKMVKCVGFSSISWIKKNRPKKIGRFNNFKSTN
jgi:thiamine-phosphate pyrophosphorylase